jgi:hypothetical protein
MKITKKYLQKITEEETKSYVGGLKASSLGAANLGFDRSAEKPGASEYSKTDRYLAQRIARFMDKILKKINRELRKLDQRLTNTEETIKILITTELDNTYVDDSQTDTPISVSARGSRKKHD